MKFSYLLGIMLEVDETTKVTCSPILYYTPVGLDIQKTSKQLQHDEVALELRRKFLECYVSSN